MTKRLFAAVMLLVATSVAVVAANIKGKVVDRQTGEVKVTGMARKNTDAAMIEAAKLSDQVVSNISAQEIRRTQDNNAGEVIRRVPGVSLIEDKFVMVRGLSQRYNSKVN